MGLARSEIKFEHKIPSFIEIQERFNKQTGLGIYLKATLNLSKLPTSIIDVMEQLYVDYPLAIELAKQEKQRNNINAINARYEEELFMCEWEKDYEKAAILRDKIKKQLELLDLFNKQGIQSPKKLNTISDFYLTVPGFYEIELDVKNNIITVNQYAGQYYAIESFCKVLFDLGGKNVDSSNPYYPAKWKKLKRWEEYAWYNRPRK